MKIRRNLCVALSAILIVCSSISVYANNKIDLVVDEDIASIRVVTEVKTIETSDIDIVVDGVELREVKTIINSNRSLTKATVYVEIGVDEYKGKYYTIPITLFGVERVVTFTYLEYDSSAKEYVYYAYVEV